MTPLYIAIGAQAAGGLTLLVLAFWLAFDSDEKPESYDPSSPFERDFYAREARR